jgi:histone acetyltransferase (RNA polymerase elongator complex component)
MTEVMTVEERQRKPRDPNLPPENERFIRACSDIVSFLVQDHEAQQDPSKPRKDVNLNALRSKMSKKHRLSNIPPLTAIIAAIPEHYKKYILPKLIAKPISECLPRELVYNILTPFRKCFRYCSSSCYVQTPSLPPHRVHRQHLRILPRRSRFRLRILYPIIHRLRTYIYASYSSTI